MTKPLCIIGDLHGRVRILESIIKDNHNCKFIILGDVIHHKSHFKRSKRCNPLKIISLLMDLTQIHGAQVIMGNNEKIFLDQLFLPFDRITHTEVKFTIQQIKSLSNPQRLRVINWFLNLPTDLEINNYRFAHAYYKDSNEGLYGPGYAWFYQQYSHLHPLDPNFQYFFGHYGRPYFRDNIHVLDCTELDAVGVYRSDYKEFKTYI
jgi:hypothetical protein